MFHYHVCLLASLLHGSWWCFPFFSWVSWPCHYLSVMSARSAVFKARGSTIYHVSSSPPKKNVPQLIFIGAWGFRCLAYLLPNVQDMRSLELDVTHVWSSNCQLREKSAASSPAADGDLKPSLKFTEDQKTANKHMNLGKPHGLLGKKPTSLWHKLVKTKLLSNYFKIPKKKRVVARNLPVWILKPNMPQLFFHDCYRGYGHK